MTCYLKRDIVEKEYRENKISEKTYQDLLKQMDEHEKLYHTPKVDKSKPKIKKEILA